MNRLGNGGMGSCEGQRTQKRGKKNGEERRGGVMRGC